MRRQSLTLPMVQRPGQPGHCEMPDPEARPGPFLRDARTKCGLTQKELAKLARSSQCHVSRIESGRVSPKIKELDRLLRAMGEHLVLTAEQN